MEFAFGFWASERHLLPSWKHSLCSAFHSLLCLSLSLPPLLLIFRPTQPFASLHKGRNFASIAPQTCLFSLLSSLLLFAKNPLSQLELQCPALPLFRLTLSPHMQILTLHPLLSQSALIIPFLEWKICRWTSSARVVRHRRTTMMEKLSLVPGSWKNWSPLLLNSDFDPPQRALV